MKKGFLLLTAILISLTFKAQLNTTNAAPYNTPTYLVNNVLLGNGVTSTNITFSGQPNQLGFFNNGLAGAINPLGLDSGIVFSTGNINQIPNGGFISTDMNPGAGPSDPDLLSIAQSVIPIITSTHDAASLEFDFVPAGDTVEFRFVFASEEYLQFINTQFNDVFAFFISGPGFAGPFASPPGFPNGSQNLAVVPGTTSPITISTIYVDPTETPPMMNGQYFINNPVGNTFDFNAYSTAISIKFHVTCGALFHFKFSIADCQDGGWDTGVFMEGSSFTSSAPTAIQFATATIGGDSTIIEGCDGAILSLTRSDTIGNATLHYTIGGTATNGVDYALIADSVTYLAGIDTASITIIPLTDALLEGTESIIITSTSINVCGNIVTSSDSIFIDDVPILSANSPNINLNCPADSILISTIITGGILDSLTYTWTDSQGNTYPDTADIFVPALLTDTFYVNVVSYCNLINVSDTIIVTVTPLFVLTTTQSDTNICVGDTINFSTASSIPGTYTYNWTSIISVLGTPTDSLTTGTFNTAGSDTVFLVVNNGGVGCTVYDTLLVNISLQPTINITTLDTLLDCVSSVPINVDLGAAPSPNDFSFNWSFPTTLDTATAQNPNATPTQGISDYIVIVTDTLGGCFDTDTLEVRSCCINQIITLENSSCFGVDDGSITVSATALNSNFIIEFYKNDPGFTFLQSSIGNPADSILNNLEPGSYIVNIFDTIGCSFSDTFLLTEPSPVTVNNISPDTNICIDGTANLYATANGINGPFSLIWNNGAIPGNGPHNIIPWTDSTFTVFAQDANGCVSPDSIIIVTLRDSITINNIELTDTTICDGESTVIVVDATGGGAGLIYTWYNGNNTIIGATDTGAFLIIPSYDGEIFTVIVSDSCTTPSVTDSITSDWSDVILPTYTISDSAGCYIDLSFTPVFTNTTPNLSLSDSSTWDFGNGTTYSWPFAIPFDYHYDDPGIYDVTLTVTDEFGCNWDTIMEGIHVYAYDQPQADFLWNPNPTDYLNAQITFNNQSTDNFFNQWLFITDVQFTSTDTNPVFQFPQDRPGSYNVTLITTTEHGCQDSITKIVVIDDVFLFYIPTAFTPDGDGLNDNFKVVGEGLDLSNFKMTVFNKWGELIFESNNPDIGWNGTQNGSLVPTGVYVWKIDAKEAHSPIIHNKDGFVTIVR